MNAHGMDLIVSMKRELREREPSLQSYLKIKVLSQKLPSFVPSDNENKKD